MATRSSKRSLAGYGQGPVVDVEWREVPPETPSLPPPFVAPPVRLRARRVSDGSPRVAAQVPTLASVMGRGSEMRGRCMVCGVPATAAVRAGPFKADVCRVHAATVNVTAFFLQHLIGG